MGAKQQQRKHSVKMPETNATREQLQAFADKLDADGDGFISREEMEAFKKVPEEEFQAFLAASDKNADGKWSKEEFVDFFFENNFPWEQVIEDFVNDAEEK